MIRTLIKYLPKDSNRQNFVLSAACGLFIFLIFYLAQTDLTISLGFGLFVFSFTLIWSLIDERLGEKRHRTILNSDAFQRLIAEGFKEENINDYYGITGIYKGYIFDIYYDWSTILKTRVYRAIVFNVYFNHPLKTSSQTNHKYLIKLSKKYDVSIWRFKPWNFWWREGNIIMKIGISVFNPKYDKLKKWMDTVVKVLQEENLQPVDRETLNGWRRKFPDNNVPEITTYFKIEK